MSDKAIEEKIKGISKTIKDREEVIKKPKENLGRLQDTLTGLIVVLE